MAKRISEPGTYHVTIGNPHWTKLEEKDGDACRMSAVLPGYCAVKGEEMTITGELYFTRSIIASGKQAGQKIAEISKDTLIKLGMPEPFNPADIACLEGVEAIFEVAEEEYRGEKRLKVKFINPPGRKSLPPEEASRIWDAITGTEPMHHETPDGDIPF